MRTTLARYAALLWLPLIALVGVAAALLGGCGEKIAIPQPTGLWGLKPYWVEATYDEEPGIVQLLGSQNRLFVLSDDELTKRDTEFEPFESATGLVDARSLCADDGDSLIFVWEHTARRVSWFNARDLQPRGSSLLPDVQSAVSMVTCKAGIDQVPGALTFLYLADPDSGVVHRYAFDLFTGLTPFGILTNRQGNGARFVKQAAGLARDSEDSLLVCDMDSSRHWVIRFNAEPDPTDFIGDIEWLRGRAVLFGAATCEPPAPADYVLGNAAECGETDWVSGPSSADGEFDMPRFVSIDGSGRIFVADHGNDRMQIFDAEGGHLISYGDDQRMPAPLSMAVIDDWLGGPNNVLWGAIIFVQIDDGARIRKYVSDDWYKRENQEPPPDDYGS